MIWWQLRMLKGCDVGVVIQFIYYDKWLLKVEFIMKLLKKIVFQLGINEIAVQKALLNWAQQNHHEGT